MIRRPPKIDSWTVNGPLVGKTLQDFLAETLKLSRRAAKQQIDARLVWVNDRCVWMAHHTLHKGDVVRVPSRAASPTSISARPKKLPVLFQDDAILVADKPAGLLTNDADASAENVLRLQCANPSLRVAHRLDRDTTGCLLFAKTDEAFDGIVRVFRNHHVRKTYRAIVYGRWDAAASTIELPIAEERALTHVTCVRANDTASYLLIRIETGRTHQIRKHLAMARHPILGDKEYGPKVVEDPVLQTVARPMLHAAELLLEHPLDASRDVKVFSKIPLDFQRMLSKLRLS